MLHNVFAHTLFFAVEIADKSCPHRNIFHDSEVERMKEKLDPEAANNTGKTIRKMSKVKEKLVWVSFHFLEVLKEKDGRSQTWEGWGNIHGIKMDSLAQRGIKSR